MVFSSKLNLFLTIRETIPTVKYSFDDVDKEFITFLIETVDEMTINGKLDYSFDEEQYFTLLKRMDSIDGFKDSHIYRIIQEIIHVIRKEKDNDFYKGKRIGAFLDLLLFLRKCKEEWEITGTK